MGIPKFFRFISERWPLISQEVDRSEIIEFDNLYLDMNSILHNCTHTNDGTITHLTDEQMFGSIFSYIDHLFDTIRPKQTFYMAIDGVAPRAKMNQQRARRFRTAVEAEENMKKAIQNGDSIPKEAPFDSNAITPGTEFMAKLTDNLKYYINQKVSTDSNWQNIKVILSGHEVPGEGEHKIMEYIRVQKAQTGYNANTRHCVYGLDADLIMLGLVSHEPHFSLLREEVSFGFKANQAKSTDLTKQKFFLLHISLVREYMQLEFQDMENELPFEYDFEKVLDDFILIMYLIGNDFLPNLPDLHIKSGAFPLLIQTFKEALKRTDGYLNENGTINMKRLGVWLEYLSNFELENFEKGEVDVDWFNQQLDNISRKGARKRERQGKEILVKQQKKILGMIREFIFHTHGKYFTIKEFEDDESKIPEKRLPREFFDSENNKEFIGKIFGELPIVLVHSKSEDTYSIRLDIDGLDPNETEEHFNERVLELRKIIKKYQSSVIVEDEDTLNNQKDIYNDKFVEWKNQYYKQKVHFTLNEEEKITDMTENYLEGLQWVLYYYYRGICSWPWYYRYHYAPRISDIAKGLNVKINFELGKPFRPYEQLLGVLPARSKSLIPACYRELMTDPKSPIIDFYPADCDIDMNGKSAPWEAVVLLSFVDEKRLVSAMESYESKLSPEEKRRNSFGKDLRFHFNANFKKLIISPIPEAFGDFESHCIEDNFELPKIKGVTFKGGLVEGSKTGRELLAGFPTLKTLPFETSMEYAGLTVFQQPARSTSMILTIKNIYSGLTVEQFSKEYAGELVYVNWPYLQEAKVIHVTDNLMKYERVKFGKSSKVISSPLENSEINEFNKKINEIYRNMSLKKGLRFDVNKDKTSSEEESEEDLEYNPSTRHHQKKIPGNIPIDGLVWVRHVTGLVRNKEGGYIKTFSKSLTPYPIQLIVEDVINKDKRYVERAPVPVTEEFPIGSQVLYLHGSGYGSSGKVVGHGQNSLSLSLNIIKTPEPTIGSQRARIESESFKYHTANDVSRILHISGYLLSRITSSYQILGADGKKNDIGLQLKYEAKQKKVLGYTRKNYKWEYSDLAINLISDYMHRFPDLFLGLNNVKTNGMPSASEIFGNIDAPKLKDKIKEIRAYIKGIVANYKTVALNSDQLTKGSIAAVEEDIINYNIKKVVAESRRVKNIPREAVLDPSKPNPFLSRQTFSLGDRVIYASDSGNVPLYSKGTVIGIEAFDSKTLLQVIFDQPLLTGNTYDGRLKTQRGLTVDGSLLLNLTTPKLVYRSQLSPEAKKLQIAKREKAAKEHQRKKEEGARAKKELLSAITGKLNGSQNIVDDKIDDAPESKKQNGKNSSAKTKEISEASAPSTHPTGVQNIYNSVMNGIFVPNGKQQLQQQNAPQHTPLPFSVTAPPNFNGLLSQSQKDIIAKSADSTKLLDILKGSSDNSNKAGSDKLLSMLK